MTALISQFENNRSVITNPFEILLQNQMILIEIVRNSHEKILYLEQQVDSLKSQIEAPVSLKVAATKTGISANTLRKFVNDGKIQNYGSEGKYTIMVSEVHRLHKK